MKPILTILIILVSVSLIGLIILQAKGTGLGSSFGGGGEFYRSKKGVEKIVTTATVILTVLFSLLSLLLLLQP